MRRLLLCALALSVIGGPARLAHAEDIRHVLESAWARNAEIAALTARRAGAFLVDSQQPGGSWGRWAGSLGATAYAVHGLTAIDGGGGAALGLGVVVAVLVATPISLELTVMLSKSILRPLRDLERAVERRFAGIQVAMKYQGGHGRAGDAGEVERDA